MYWCFIKVCPDVFYKLCYLVDVVNWNNKDGKRKFSFVLTKSFKTFTDIFGSLDRWRFWKNQVKQPVRKNKVFCQNFGWKSIFFRRFVFLAVSHFVMFFKMTFLFIFDAEDRTLMEAIKHVCKFAYFYVTLMIFLSFFIKFTFDNAFPLFQWLWTKKNSSWWWRKSSLIGKQKIASFFAKT